MIDVIIMWLDGNDPEWLLEKNKYADKDVSAGSDENRFRSWDNLKYVFRGIEKNMPWVRTVHLVTWGHVPEWLNLDAPKLKVVTHDDYMPKKYLPTFSSHPISLNFHRITTLSENFIILNDDTFIIRPMKVSDFFYKGRVPRAQSGLSTINSNDMRDLMPHTYVNNNAIINSQFNARKVMKNNFFKYISLRNGIDSVCRYILLLPFSLNRIQHPNTPHFPPAMTKSTYEEVWKSYPDIMDKTSRTKFRSATDVSDYLLQQWQISRGNFLPRNIKGRSVYVESYPKDIPKLKRALRNRRIQQVCINDHSVEGNFEEIKKKVNSILDERLPDKSSFEK